MIPKFTEFTLEGDAQVYKLCFDFNLLCDAEKETGLNLRYAILNLDTMSALQHRAVLYALLKTGHKAVELKEAGELLSRGCGDRLGGDEKSARHQRWRRCVVCVSLENGRRASF